MGIGPSDIYLISVFLILWFGLVRLVKSKPQTKPNHVVEAKIDPNTSEPNAVFCGFGLVWFGLRFFY